MTIREDCTTQHGDGYDKLGDALSTMGFGMMIGILDFPIPISTATKSALPIAGRADLRSCAPKSRRELDSGR
jgi:hypothetical protein